MCTWTYSYTNAHLSRFIPWRIWRPYKNNQTKNATKIKWHHAKKRELWLTLLNPALVFKNELVPDLKGPNNS